MARVRPGQTESQKLSCMIAREETVDTGSLRSSHVTCTRRAGECAAAYKGVCQHITTQLGRRARQCEDVALGIPSLSSGSGGLLSAPCFRFGHSDPCSFSFLSYLFSIAVHLLFFPIPWIVLSFSLSFSVLLFLCLAFRLFLPSYLPSSF